MKKLHVILLAASVAAAAAGCSTSQRFGAPPSVSGKALPLGQALAPANVGKTIAIEGQVTEVCQMEGCWMVVTDGKLSVRTTFKDYGFFVPKDLAGAHVVAEGTLTARDRLRGNAPALRRRRRTECRRNRFDPWLDRGVRLRRRLGDRTPLIQPYRTE